MGNRLGGTALLVISCRVRYPLPNFLLENENLMPGFINGYNLNFLITKRDSKQGQTDAKKPEWFSFADKWWLNRHCLKWGRQFPDRAIRQIDNYATYWGAWTCHLWPLYRTSRRQTETQIATGNIWENLVKLTLWWTARMQIFDKTDALKRGCLHKILGNFELEQIREIKTGLYLLSIRLYNVTKTFFKCFHLNL